MEFQAIPNSIKGFARSHSRNKTPIKNGNKFDFDGEDHIEFEDRDETLHFFFPQDFAWLGSDSTDNASSRVPVRRYFYSKGNKHFMLVGVPWLWVNQAPAGELIIDPSPTTVAVDRDVYIVDETNKNYKKFLDVGIADNLPKRRSLIKFDLNAAGVPSNATVVNSLLKLKFYSTSGSGTIIDRTVNAHQVLKNWREAQATRDIRLNNSGTDVPWGTQYGQIGGTNADINGTAESATIFTIAEQQNIGSTGPLSKSWSLTDLTQAWVDGSENNNGVLLWATNEDIAGKYLRFHSSEAVNSADQPVLEVTWSTQSKSVYFLKDHLGSIRATFDETATVVGYDDYDPWGYILENRSMASAWSSGQNVAKNKYTGKEWDDDYGLSWYYYGARYYDPEVGMWFSLDPAGQYASPYTFVGKQPAGVCGSEWRIRVVYTCRCNNWRH